MTIKGTETILILSEWFWEWLVPNWRA